MQNTKTYSTALITERIQCHVIVRLTNSVDSSHVRFTSSRIYVNVDESTTVLGIMTPPLKDRSRGGVINSQNLRFENWRGALLTTKKSANLLGGRY